ncbi:hypothetical protein FOXG_13814 [Fusarium oxysporum f. sp. lycopersici 4287]|uniref:Uncharacterized protein n=2 Tax=Fusarium oxysporum TaxID=5507 RepID=A0A0J9VWM6_FUSO4|nr:hypothetical protein FOXG_13814 [Fusarium oxysporum f. sp. lycopersici 4287]KNB15136.1 hypothetical protein FOXG_13814 [Fusarium oxysporum f. sp. lycopersici 4287]
MENPAQQRHFQFRLYSPRSGSSHGALVVPVPHFALISSCKSEYSTDSQPSHAEISISTLFNLGILQKDGQREEETHQRDYQIGDSDTRNSQSQDKMLNCRRQAKNETRIQEQPHKIQWVCKVLRNGSFEDFLGRVRGSQKSTPNEP